MRGKERERGRGRGERKRERRRERERAHTHGRNREKALWLLLLYVFSSTWACPMQIGLSQECCLFYLKSSLWSLDLPLTLLSSIFAGFSLPFLLATAIWTPFPYSTYLTLVIKRCIYVRSWTGPCEALPVMKVPLSPSFLFAEKYCSLVEPFLNSKRQIQLPIGEVRESRSKEKTVKKQ